MTIGIKKCLIDGEVKIKIKKTYVSRPMVTITKGNIKFNSKSVLSYTPYEHGLIQAIYLRISIKR